MENARDIALKVLEQEYVPCLVDKYNDGKEKLVFMDKRALSRTILPCEQIELTEVMQYSRINSVAWLVAMYVFNVNVGVKSSVKH